jgi:hypothetical protein
MPNEHQLTLCQDDEARTDFAPIESTLEVIQVRLTLLPTRKNLRRLKVLATPTTSALVGVGTKVLPR